MENLYSDGETSKSRLKTLGITLGIILVVFLAVSGFVTLSSINETNQKRAEALAKIQENYEKGNYSFALEEIDTFQKTYESANQTEINSFLETIEEKMYGAIQSKSNDNDITIACKQYLNHFPNGKYAQSTKQLLSDAYERLAPVKFADAQDYIKEQQYYSAESELNDIINNSPNFSKYNEAKALLASVKKTIEQLAKYSSAKSKADRYALDHARQIMKTQLIDPESAVFSNEEIVDTDPYLRYLVKLSVNSKTDLAVM